MDIDELIIKLKLLGFKEDNNLMFAHYIYTYKNLKIYYYGKEKGNLNAYVDGNNVCNGTSYIASRLLEHILHIIKAYKSTKTDEEALNLFRSLEWKYQID